jgi:hypothetical protein
MHAVLRKELMFFGRFRSVSYYERDWFIMMHMHAESLRLVCVVVVRFITILFFLCV